MKQRVNAEGGKSLQEEALGHLLPYQGGHLGQQLQHNQSMVVGSAIFIYINKIMIGHILPILECH